MSNPHADYLPPQSELNAIANEKLRQRVAELEHMNSDLRKSVDELSALIFRTGGSDGSEAFSEKEEKIVDF